VRKGSRDELYGEREEVRGLYPRRAQRSNKRSRRMELNYDNCGVCGTDLAGQTEEVYACALCWRLVCASGACMWKFDSASLYAVCSKCADVEVALGAPCTWSVISPTSARHHRRGVAAFMSPPPVKLMAFIIDVARGVPSPDRRVA
jgi:hypothetical protein